MENKGWICPKCDSANAPWSPYCMRCPKKEASLFSKPPEMFPPPLFRRDIFALHEPKKWTLDDLIEERITKGATQS